MSATDICSKLIHSGAVSGFAAADYVDLAPMLWSRPPQHGWLSSGSGTCLRDALEQNLYIAETPDRRRQRQLFSHVRIAIPATIYTSLETRFPGDFPASMEAELVALHQEDLEVSQQAGSSVRYRIEPDADLPEDTVRYRFGVAIYVRARAENAQWHIHFGPDSQPHSEHQVIPLHREETALLIGPDLYQSSYAFRDWPLSNDVRLLISHKQQPDGARVALRPVSGVPEGGIEVHQEGWTITDHQGNCIQMRYSAAPCADYLADNHTQMDAQAEHTVYFQQRAARQRAENPDITRTLNPKPHHDTVVAQPRGVDPAVEDAIVEETTVASPAVAEAVAETLAALQTPEPGDSRPRKPRRQQRASTQSSWQRPVYSSPEQAAPKPSGLLIRGIALQRSALSLDADGERRLALTRMIRGADQQLENDTSLLVDHADQLRLEHRGEIALLDDQRPVMLPGLKLPLYPIPGALRDDYLGWLPLSKALLVSEFTDETVLQLDSRILNQALALHCGLMPPQPLDGQSSGSPIAAQLQHRGGQIALRTGDQGSSYLVPQRDSRNSPPRGHSLPPLTTVVRDKAAAFTLICSQYVLEYCPPRA